MKVWVIGGAGYIGSHICKKFLSEGHEVVVFDDLSSGWKENLPKEVTFRKGDILEMDTLRTAAREFRFDGVIHLAALKAAGDSMREPERYSRHNISGSLNVLQAVLEAGIPQFVFSSTAAVYGAPDYLPMDEKHPTRPENFYGYTKLTIEGFLEWYGKLKGLRHVCLRYFNAAGYEPDGSIVGLERNPANLLPVVMETAMGWRPKLQIFGNDYGTRDGTCIRDYIHVSDLASAHLAAMEYLTQGGKNAILNLGTGQGISVMEMVKTARNITGKEIPIEIVGRRVGDPESVLASSDLAALVLGWKAEISDVKSLLSTTWNAYLANAQRGSSQKL